MNDVRSPVLNIGITLAIFIPQGTTPFESDRLVMCVNELPILYIVDLINLEGRLFLSRLFFVLILLLALTRSNCVTGSRKRLCPFGFVMFSSGMPML